jgi:hypothetical protein
MDEKFIDSFNDSAAAALPLAPFLTTPLDQ